MDLAGSLDSLQADGDVRGRRLRVAADPLAADHRRPSTGSAGGARSSPRARPPTRSGSQQWVLHRAGRRRWTGSPTRSAGAAGPTWATPSRFDGAGAGTQRGDAQRAPDRLAARAGSRVRQLPAGGAGRRDARGLGAVGEPAPPARRSTARACSRRPAASRARRRATSSVQVLGLDLHDVYGLLQRDTTRRARRGRARPAGRRHRRGADASADSPGWPTARFGDFQSPFVQGVLNYERPPARRQPRPLAHRREPAAGRGPPAARPGAHAASRSGRSTARSRSGRTRDSVSSACSRRSRRPSPAWAARSRPTSRSSGTWAAAAARGRDRRSRTAACRFPGSACASAAVQRRRDARRATRCRCTTCCSRAAAAGSRSAARCGSRTSRGRSSTSTSRPSQFRAIDVRSFLTLVGTGDLAARGPVFGATLTGSLLANSGVLYFADLVNKRIIDLEDPSIADLVDTTLIRRENLGAKFQNRFLDSLRIDDLRVEMGSDVWLRSAEANIQLEGRVRVSKAGADVQPDRHAERAARHLHAQDRSRHPRLHGDARPGDLHRRPERRARHRGAAHRAQRPRRRDPDHRATSPARCTQPKLTLESTVRPPISETDLVSYLITGYPANEATALGQGGALQTGLAYFSSALSSELERALIQDIGVPIDLIEIRPGVSSSPSGAATAHPARRRMADRQEDVPHLQRRLLSRLQPAELQESRRQPRVPLQPRVEAPELGRADHPVVHHVRRSSNQLANTSPYQIGFDILWEREF